MTETLFIRHLKRKKCFTCCASVSAGVGSATERAKEKSHSGGKGNPRFIFGSFFLYFNLFYFFVSLLSLFFSLTIFVHFCILPKFCLLFSFFVIIIFLKDKEENKMPIAAIPSRRSLIPSISYKMVTPVLPFFFKTEKINRFI